MSRAYISDIHSNPIALEAVLDDIESLGIREVDVLGDVFGRGFDPVGTERLLTSDRFTFRYIPGNHEDNIGALRKNSRLSKTFLGVGTETFNSYERHIAILSDPSPLETQLISDDNADSSRLYYHDDGCLIIGVHAGFCEGGTYASLTDDALWPYVLDAAQNERMTSSNFEGAKIHARRAADFVKSNSEYAGVGKVILVHGHTHLASFSDKFSFDGLDVLVVDIGSVGWPRRSLPSFFNGDKGARATYGVWFGLNDSLPAGFQKGFSICSVWYDWEKCTEKITSVNSDGGPQLSLADNWRRNG